MNSSILLAVVALSFAAQLSGCCSDEGCEDVVTISGRLGSNPRHLQIVACRSGVCGELLLEPPTSGGTTYTDLRLERGGTFVCAIGFASDGTRKLSVTLRGGNLEEGESDTYELRVVDTDSNATLVDVEETVTYSDSASDSALCGRDCQSAEIDFAPVASG